MKIGDIILFIGIICLVLCAASINHLSNGTKLVADDIKTAIYTNNTGEHFNIDKITIKIISVNDNGIVEYEDYTGKHFVSTRKELFKNYHYKY